MAKLYNKQGTVKKEQPRNNTINYKNRRKWRCSHTLQKNEHTITKYALHHQSNGKKEPGRHGEL